MDQSRWDVETRRGCRHADVDVLLDDGDGDGDTPSGITSHGVSMSCTQVSDVVFTLGDADYMQVTSRLAPLSLMTG